MEELTKFAVAMYNKGSKDTLVGVAIGAVIGATAITYFTWVQWKRENHKQIKQSETES